MPCHDAVLPVTRAEYIPLCEFEESKVIVLPPFAYQGAKDPVSNPGLATKFEPGAFVGGAVVGAGLIVGVNVGQNSQSVGDDGMQHLS
mmetsp:Transcript_25667/g.59208  ORF Transcript_25667/g.59208 Transcript_25667/m.59208 type:complete len:88 (+) Transcript_25667:458-721(+)